MSGDHDLWLPLSNDALRARRESRARRQARRRRALAAGGLVAGLAVLVALVALISGGSTTHSQTALSRLGVGGEGHHGATTFAALRVKRIRRSEALIAREDAAIDRLLRRQQFITVGGSQRREIALTFDDGPGPYTPQLLDQLQRLHVPATFFEVGFMFRWFHDAFSREMRMGDVVGDHTESHPMMAELPASAQTDQIISQTEWVHKYGGPFPRLWRPPYGSFNATTLSILKRERMLMVLWTVDSEDYRQPGVQVIFDRVLSGARPGAIILMHDAGGVRSQTIAALPLIVHALRKRGYRLVTVPQLVLDDPPHGHQNLPTHLAGG